MTPSVLSASVTIRAEARALYEMVADVTRMGEWSPVCTGCTWDDEKQRGPGAWFTGHNETPERTWDTRCLVVSAAPGREFAFVVGGNRTRWAYNFRPAEGGTEVIESWELLPPGRAMLEERYGDRAGAEIAARVEAARTGIAQSLARLKAAAEQGA